MKKGYLVHYGEIALKGENRSFFENKLISNIENAVSDLNLEKNPVKNLYGRLFLQLPSNEIASSEPCTQRGTAVITRQKEDRGLKSATSISNRLEFRLKKIPGIANFSPAYLAERDLDKLKELIWQETKQRMPFETFRIRASRADKSFPLTSRDIEFKIGGYVKEKSQAEVDLENAKLSCYIEILSDKALFYFEKIPGPGGLPVTTAGKVGALLSGGIDSPVAAWKIAKRGAKNVFIHFHSYPQTDKASQEKVKDFVRTLVKWQGTSTLFLVPLLKIQEEIVAQCPKKLRVILYRRMMLRIAEKIAKKENCLALVTGESLGQVASQTIENMRVTEAVTTLPVFRPLIGMDKQQIVGTAKKIGTYETAIKPHQDCCSLFVPQHPETRAKLEMVEKAEKLLQLENLIDCALENSTRDKFSFPSSA
ncbi:MAG: tRNA uracil 4-sulfurtransferase ThiI [Patescibacteria group bacterium]